MHESSSLTLIYKYLFPITWAGMMLAFFIIPWDNPEQSFGPPIVILTTAMIWLIILAVRLRTVTANSSHLIMGSFQGNKKIDYKNIEYVSEAAFINPRLITLKYHEPKTGESDIILIMPSTTSEMFRFKFLQEHDMTQYIREQIFIHNPAYSTKREPSRWRTPGLVFLTLAASSLLGALLDSWPGG